MLDILNTKIEIGLEKPVKILHVTDIHITEVSELDEPWQQELMKERIGVFYREGKEPESTPEEFFREAIATAKELGALLVCTGDAYDIHTKGNLAKFKEIIKGEDMMFSPGGHEYQKQIVRTLEEPDGYGRKMEQQLKAEIPEFDLDFESRVVGGVNIITANNALDFYGIPVAERLKAELEKGLPIIVFSHDPLDDKLLNMGEPYHPNVQISAEEYAANAWVLDTLTKNPQVVTTFTGHHHVMKDYEIEDKMHYMTGGLFKGICRLIELV